MLLTYIPSSTFTGPKKGYVFKTDVYGTGYYLDKNVYKGPGLSEWYFQQKQQKRRKLN